MLSIGGRSTLLSSVLGSLGLYFMIMFLMSVQVKKMLESLRAQIFWGGEEGSRKIHWIS